MVPYLDESLVQSYLLLFIIDLVILWSSLVSLLFFYFELLFYNSKSYGNEENVITFFIFLFCFCVGYILGRNIL